ncbi:RGCVC family protein [Blastococcus aggregatus]|uniref:RGCVC family protein n=1 Tax=Blastococcus aggregatus TaxID=38502 RepID=UPI0015968D3F|nr:RGCVC family protein [Blastococcus aggregatus]
MTSAPSATPTVEHAPADACGNCPHPLSAHDAISLRFCRATQAGDLPRGCACPPS